MKVAALLLVTLFAFTLAQFNLGQHFDGAFEASLHVGQQRVAPLYNPFAVTFTLTNTLPHPVKVLKWDTPLDGVKGNVLKFLHAESGEEAVYYGMIVKRDYENIPEEAYVTIGARDSITTLLSIPEHYFFMKDGSYEVSVSFDLHFENLNRAIEVSTPTYNIEIVDTNPEVFLDIVHKQSRATQTRNVEDISYVGCSSTQQNTIASALTVAKSDAAQARNYMQSGSCTGDYVTWFGSVTTSRFNTVYSNWESIVSQLNSGNYRFDCGTCNMPGTYAYVYPFDPRFTVYFCNVFWRSSGASHTENSQPGTITHETSHFNAVAGTDDIQYGTSGAQQLARTSPSSAIKNADSYEYFQEFNPHC